MIKVREARLAFISIRDELLFISQSCNRQSNRLINLSSFSSPDENRRHVSLSLNIESKDNSRNRNSCTNKWIYIYIYHLSERSRVILMFANPCLRRAPFCIKRSKCRRIRFRISQQVLQHCYPLSLCKFKIKGICSTLDVCARCEYIGTLFLRKLNGALT